MASASKILLLLLLGSPASAGYCPADYAHSAKLSGRALQARNAGAGHLIHRTDFALLPSIIESGGLIPGREVPKKILAKALKPEEDFVTGKYGKIFLSLWPKATEIQDYQYRSMFRMGKKRPTKVVLDFDMNLLNREDFFMNPTYEYGKRSARSYSTIHFADFLKTGAKEVVNRMSGRKVWNFGNELVYGKKIPVEALREIWVDPEGLPQLERILKPYREQLDEMGVKILVKPKE